MPRVTVTENWVEFTSAESDDPMNDNLDYCRGCYEYLVLEDIAAKYGVPEEAVEMPATDGYMHDPDFTHTCENCGRELTIKDQ